jgi:hypothetical protein
MGDGIAIERVAEGSISRLRELNCQLRAMAFLVENLGDLAAVPSDMEDRFWGLGMILEGLSDEIEDVRIGIRNAKYPEEAEDE